MNDPDYSLLGDWFLPDSTACDACLHAWDTGGRRREDSVTLSIFMFAAWSWVKANGTL